MRHFTPQRSIGIMMLSGIAILGFNLMSMPSSAQAAEPPPEWDGLLRVPDKGADHLYLHRDADFSTFTHLKVSPVQISFDPDWQPNGRVRGGHRIMTDKDMEQLRASLATEFHSILEDRLRSAGYTITDMDGENVLLVTPQIIDLYVTAPSTSAGRSRRYVTNTGHMTMVLQLHDSVSGQLLGRVVDTQSGRRGGGFAIAGPVTNLADARTAINNWATMAATALDHAKQSSSAEALAEKHTEGQAKPR